MAVPPAGVHVTWRTGRCSRGVSCNPEAAVSGSDLTAGSGVESAGADGSCMPTLDSSTASNRDERHTGRTSLAAAPGPRLSLGDWLPRSQPHLVPPAMAEPS